jgi:hypothetical protein
LLCVFASIAGTTPVSITVQELAPIPAHHHSNRMARAHLEAPVRCNG